MEKWREVWRNGFAMVLPTAGLEALREALATDDQRLIQGVATTPLALAFMQGCPVEGACAISYCGWRGDGLETVGQVEEFYVRMCRDANQRLGVLPAYRDFLQWFDSTPRAEVLRELLAEVELTLAGRLAEPDAIVPAVTDPLEAVL